MACGIALDEQLNHKSECFKHMRQLETFRAGHSRAQQEPIDRPSQDASISQ